MSCVDQKLSTLQEMIDSLFSIRIGTNSRNIIGKNPSMVIPLLANQDLTPLLC